MKIAECGFQAKWQDLWIGAFWKTHRITTDDGQVPFITEIWVCFVPCFPLHIRIHHDVVIDFSGGRR